MMGIIWNFSSLVDNLKKNPMFINNKLQMIEIINHSKISETLFIGVITNSLRIVFLLVTFLPAG